MTLPRRRTAWEAAGLVLLVAAAVPPGGRPVRAQEQPPNPFAPPWANLTGPTVFREKGGGVCHPIRGLGPMAGPDLARGGRKSFLDLGAAMSNHLAG